MKTIRVTGKGRATAPVDRVVLRLEVSAQEMDYEDAVNELNRRVQRLRKDVSKAGAPVEELKTTSFSVDAQTHWDNEGKERLFLGYRARHHMVLELAWDQDQLNLLLRQLAKGKSCADLRIGFTVSDQEALKEAALADAVQSARRQAEILARAAGVTLGALQSIEHSWAEVRFERRNMDYCLEEARGAPMADVDPEDIDTSEEATLVWEIRARAVRKR